MNSDIASSKVLQASAAVLSYQHTDYLGEPAAPAGTVTVTITKADGTAIATDAATSLATNVSSYTLAVDDVPEPDQLTAVWTDDGNEVATTVHDVVGGFYCTVAQLRAVESLKDAAKHPTAALQADRFEVETQVESWCKRAFVPRFRTDIIRSDGGCRLVLPFPNLLSVAFANYWTGTAWASVSGTLSYIMEDPVGWADLQDGTLPTGPIQIGYRHGFKHVPADLHNATVKAIANHRHGDQSGLSSRVTSVTENGMTATLATPGVRNWVTADPFVDEVLNRPGYKWDPPVAG